LKERLLQSIRGSDCGDIERSYELTKVINIVSSDIQGGKERAAESRTGREPNACRGFME